MSWKHFQVFVFCSFAFEHRSEKKCLKREMKIIVLLNLLLASSVLCEDKEIVGIGKRKIDDGLLVRLSQKSEKFQQPTTIRLTFEFNLGQRYLTYVSFTSPFDAAKATWNATVREADNFHKVSVIFDVKDQLEFQIDANVFGYLYSPGPVYP